MRTIIYTLFILSWIAEGTILRLTAQQTPITAEVISERVRTGGLVDAAQALTQKSGTRSQRELDVIGDALVAFALSASNIARTSTGEEATRNRDLASAAVSVLRDAARDPRGGMPYLGAAERLERIASGPERVGVEAVVALVFLPDKSQALDRLRHIATLDVYAAPTAVSLLNQPFHTGPEGLAVLQQLCLEGRVAHAIAKDDLDRIAAVHGWICNEFSLWRPQ